MVTTRSFLSESRGRQLRYERVSVPHPLGEATDVRGLGVDAEVEVEAVEMIGRCCSRHRSCRGFLVIPGPAAIAPAVAEGSGRLYE